MHLKYIFFTGAPFFSSSWNDLVIKFCSQGFFKSEKNLKEKDKDDKKEKGYFFGGS